MKRNLFWSSLFALLLLASARAALNPADLRCEYRRDPLGIDVTQPRLSWVLESASSGDRSQVQTGYQVLVASSAELLDREMGDLWDSGPVFSAQSIHVPYAGKPLKSHQECFWKVRAWDKAGKASRWSPAARWSMGLLAASDWTGQWIGKDEVPPSARLGDAQWIWFPEGDAAQAAPVGARFFRKVIHVPAGRGLQTARLLVSADNQFDAFLNGEQLGHGANFKTLSEFDLGDKLKAGPNTLAIQAINDGEAPNPAGLIASLRMNFVQGDPIVIATDDSWRTARESAAGWEKSGFNDATWVASRKLGSVGRAPWGELQAPEDRVLPARMLRREFIVDKPVRRATAYFSGLGVSELYLNGSKVSDQVLSPALTEYPKRVFYVTHDVSRLLKPGTNAVGAYLGNGRYFAPRLGAPTETRTYGYPQMRLQLHLEYADGSLAEVVSDERWRLTTEGPIRANNEYDGEEYDARKEMPGWAEAGFDAAAWSAPEVVAAPGGQLVAQMQEPIRVTEVLPTVSMKQLAPGVYIYDLGQNMVGWCRLRVQGPRGTTVTLRHAELLKPDGSLYLDNIRGAKVTDRYTLKGGGPESYEPRFVYHGFRFVELRWPEGVPGVFSIEGCVVHDDLETAGEWVSSQPTLNRILQNVRWGVRGNYRSLPTDCPQRDERQGWLGDRSAESKGESFLYHTAALYSKWVQDFADAQKESGSVSDVCPPYWPLYSDNVTWPSSTVIIPGHLWEQFGDTTVIARHYPSMKLWMDHMATYIKDDLMPRDTYGDWCVPPEDASLIHSKDPWRKTAPEVLGTTYYIHCLDRMAQYATLLGKIQDAAGDRDRAARMRVAFNRKYLREADGWYDNGSQTSCVLPLTFGIVPPAQRTRVFARLIDKITNESRNHVGTGLIGGQWLMRTLTQNGRADLGYRLATNQTYPSWGYMLGKGATTVWELWNGDTADPAMNSGNHVMLVGDLVIWCYEDLAGIQADPARPGFKHILMKPRPVGDLTSVRATHRSPYGQISSHWRRGDDGRFEWEVTVPPNTTATVSIPARDTKSVREGGKPAAGARGVKMLRAEEGYAVMEVGSGTYQFEAR